MRFFSFFIFCVLAQSLYGQGFFAKGSFDFVNADYTPRHFLRPPAPFESKQELDGYADFSNYLSFSGEIGYSIGSVSIATGIYRNRESHLIGGIFEGAYFRYSRAGMDFLQVPIKVSWYPGLLQAKRVKYGINLGLLVTPKGQFKSWSSLSNLSPHEAIDKETYPTETAYIRIENSVGSYSNSRPGLSPMLGFDLTYSLNPSWSIFFDYTYGFSSFQPLYGFSANYKDFDMTEPVTRYFYASGRFYAFKFGFVYRLNQD